MPENEITVPAAPKQAAQKFLEVPSDPNKLPDLPWSVNPDCKNNLIERYGEEGAAIMYRRVALKYGHFDPASETLGYRPDLHA